MIHFDDYAQPEIDTMIHNKVRFSRVRSKTVTRGGTEMTVEIRMDNRANFISELLDIPGVHDATLVACQTEAGA